MRTQATRTITTATVGAEEGQDAVGPTIGAAGVPVVKMACRVDPGTFILEGSNFQKTGQWNSAAR
jgi:hypothetical protein